jgi:hypothetical protein
MEDFGPLKDVAKAIDLAPIDGGMLIDE